MRMRFALALFLLITATRANDEYVEERFIDAASFGGTVYIAISPGTILASKTKHTTSHPQHRNHEGLPTLVGHLPQDLNLRKWELMIVSFVS